METSEPRAPVDYPERTEHSVRNTCRAAFDVRSAEQPELRQLASGKGGESL